MQDRDTHLFCHRCGAILKPGKGDWYVVRIEAFADPTGPEISLEDLSGDIDGQIDALIEQMKLMSQQELMDQVYRRLTIHLCRQCYMKWIDNHAGE